MSFPARLQAAIGAAGITQAELARAAGVSGASVSDWVRGVTQPENLKAEPLLKAARRLHVNPDWLLIGTGPQHRHGPAARLDLAEPEPAPYAPDSAWPLGGIDRAALAALARDDLMRLEGAWLLVARQLGFDLQPRRPPPPT